MEFRLANKAQYKNMNNEKKIVILAGPNGAGKTTFAREFLPKEAHCLTFINADLIAAGLSPFEPETAAIKAGKLMLETINENITHNHSFAFETTLAGKGYAKKIPIWQKKGYHVKLFFLKLAIVDIAIDRVAARVQQGGHSIPKDIIKRRFYLGIDNFNNIYKNLVDSWLLYDNSDKEPKLITWGQNDN